MTRPLSTKERSSHALPLLATDNTITCWGSNDDGRADAPAGTYKTVTAGGLHSCALATDNTITCWGPVPSPEGVRWVSSDS